MTSLAVAIHSLFAASPPIEWSEESNPVRILDLVASGFRADVTLLGAAGLLVLAGAAVITVGALTRSATWLGTGITVTVIFALLFGGLLALFGVATAHTADRAESAMKRSATARVQESAREFGPLLPPKPAEPVNPLPGAEKVRTEIRRMVAASFNAASGAVVDEAGAPLRPAAVAFSSAACGETGVAVQLHLAFRTHDNAASMGRILAVWDEAGYAPDYAMHEEIRYSDSRLIERMGLRDRTTIDGLIHMSIVGACATP
ncbi:hypothetical protein [Microbacterium stercoris]|uniref:Uncharacterized protein n=1 Tax=Microbacterium stercoris TaxID=2820289 RepID=A0A939QP09_9MICO|nr:hypothetical protein [Microbacterium stercoris]MBO3662916.1 hypothetical protein [Microbacterium stercoris]